jgi:hypothetical protein
VPMAERPVRHRGRPDGGAGRWMPVAPVAVADATVLETKEETGRRKKTVEEEKGKSFVVV